MRLPEKEPWEPGFLAPSPEASLLSDAVKPKASSRAVWRGDCASAEEALLPYNNPPYSLDKASKPISRTIQISGNARRERQRLVRDLGVDSKSAPLLSLHSFLYSASFVGLLL